MEGAYSPMTRKEGYELQSSVCQDLIVKTLKKKKMSRAWLKDPQLRVASKEHEGVLRQVRAESSRSLGGACNCTRCTLTQRIWLRSRLRLACESRLSRQPAWLTLPRKHDRPSVSVRDFVEKTWNFISSKVELWEINGKEVSRVKYMKQKYFDKIYQNRKNVFSKIYQNRKNIFSKIYHFCRNPHYCSNYNYYIIILYCI